MPEPIPSAATLSERMALSMEASIIASNPDADPEAVSGAVRGSNGLLAAMLRATALTGRSTHAHLSWWGLQYFPDTAEAEQLARHASIWGLSRRPATLAVGSATGRITAGATIPSGTVFLSAAGVSLETMLPATADGAGNVSLSLRALVGGTAGNVSAGASLSPQGALSGWQGGSGVVAAGGIAGGAAEETDQELGVRLLDHIRERPHGGAGFDYQKWVVENFAAMKVRAVTDWIGRGSVGVIVAMRGDDGLPRAPNAAELEAMLAYLGAPGSSTGVRPVTANVVMVSAVPTAINASVFVSPTSSAVQTAVRTAFERFINADAEIGGTLYPSRLSEALSAAVGEYRHVLVSPAHSAPITMAPSAVPIPGTLSFVSEPT